MKHTFKQWFFATRPWSFPVSTLSVIISTAMLYYMSQHMENPFTINWWMALGALVSIIIFHAAGNLLSDWYDHRKGIDAEDTVGVKILTSGEFQPKEILTFGSILLVLAIIAGTTLCYFSYVLTGNWYLLIFGALGILLTIGYPWTKTHALGEVNIALAYGFVPALGTSLAVTGDIQVEILWAVPLFAATTIAVLWANNVRDVPTDKRANIVTVPMLIGKKASIVIYDLLIWFPIVWTVVCCGMGKLPWLALLVVCACKMIVANCKMAHAFLKDDHAIDHLDERTPPILMLTSVILVLAIAIDHFIQLLF